MSYLYPYVFSSPKVNTPQNDTSELCSYTIHNPWMYDLTQKNMAKMMGKSLPWSYTQDSTIAD